MVNIIDKLWLMLLIIAVKVILAEDCKSWLLEDTSGLSDWFAQTFMRGASQAMLLLPWKLMESKLVKLLNKSL